MMVWSLEADGWLFGVWELSREGYVAFCCTYLVLLEFTRLGDVMCPSYVSLYLQFRQENIIQKNGKHSIIIDGRDGNSSVT